MNTLLQVTQAHLGNGNVELGRTLLLNYFRQRLMEERLPSVICFYNEGVKLLAGDQEITSVLKEVEAKGVKLLACKTCLDFFAIEQLEVGVVGSMIDIITLQDNADKIISI